MYDGKLMMIRCGVGFPHCGDNIPGVICYVCGMYPLDPTDFHPVCGISP